LALLLALLAVAPGCGKRKMPPPPPPAPKAPVAPPAPPKPAAPGVPQELKTLFEREWPAIQKQGDAFVLKFQEAQAARAADNRTAMEAPVKEASQLFNELNDRWAEIYYWAENKAADGEITEASAEACRKFLEPANKQVEGWVKKNKILKEFSTAK
jgi:hypothetical protein